MIDKHSTSDKIVTSNIDAPVAKKKPFEITKHNHKRTDNYYWLNNRNDPEVIRYIEEENEYTRKILSDTENLKQKLFNEIIGRIKQEDESVPYKLNGYYYYTRYVAGKEYPIYCRKKESLNNNEEILLDVNELAKGYDYYHVTGLSVSPDNKMLAFGVDAVSRRIYTIHFKDLQSNEILKDEILNTTGSAIWANDNKTLFYSVKDDSLRPYKIFRYKFNEQLEDEEIFHETDETYAADVYKSKSGDVILIGSYSTLSTEFRFIMADNPDQEFKVIQPREKKLEYSVYHLDDKFFIRTNLEAKNFRIMAADVQNPGKENWKEIVPHRTNVFIENMTVFKEFFALEERENGLIKIRIKDWQGKIDYHVPMNEDTYVVYFSMNYEISSSTLRYNYSSLTTPNSVYDFNILTKEKKLLKREDILGGFNSNEYHSERLYAPSHDGVKIPISLVYKKGITKNGSNPLLLYGYGSYGISTDPLFNSARISLLDRGFIFAIAHIRGGQELGRGWYEDGKLLKKKNTFYDFVACSEYLVNANYTSKEKLFAIGGSAGGLLIGATINLRPDLFKGVVAAVPFVDVVTTMLDDSIPLTTGEYDEWGNPNIKEFYEYMLSYSPYDNVEENEYPNILVTTGLHDSQVQYWEPAKWVAKLRDVKLDNNILLMYTEMTAGHSGASGRFERHKNTALEYSFFLKLLGINE